MTHFYDTCVWWSLVIEKLRTEIRSIVMILLQFWSWYRKIYVNITVTSTSSLLNSCSLLKLFEITKKYVKTNKIKILFEIFLDMSIRNTIIRACLWLLWYIYLIISCFLVTFGNYKYMKRQKNNDKQVNYKCNFNIITFIYFFFLCIYRIFVCFSLVFAFFCRMCGRTSRKPGKTCEKNWK